MPGLQRAFHILVLYHILLNAESKNKGVRRKNKKVAKKMRRMRMMEEGKNG